MEEVVVTPRAALGTVTLNDIASLEGRGTSGVLSSSFEHEERPAAETSNAAESMPIFEIVFFIVIVCYDCKSRDVRSLCILKRVVRWKVR